MILSHLGSNCPLLDNHLSRNKLQRLELRNEHRHAVVSKSGQHGHVLDKVEVQAARDVHSEEEGQAVQYLLLVVNRRPLPLVHLEEEKGRERRERTQAELYG